jgi:hypothetical protein
MKMKTLYSFLAGAAISASVLAFTAFRQADEVPSYASVNVYETLAAGNNILIVYENSTTEEIELAKPMSGEKLKSNTLKIHETVNMMTHKGYKVVSVAARPTGVTTFLFQKK